MNKVSLQTSLERNSTNSSYIFILSVNFENLIVGLHVLIILHVCKISRRSQINYFIIKQMLKLISSFCNLKLYIKKKKKFIDLIVNNIRFERNL